jgi:alkylation response protein AidB-like acyl-CoA dehydrogenase
MATEEEYQAAESLEEYLGDPLNPENIFSFKNSMELDEAEKYPEESCRLLHQWGVSLYYVPVEYGGRLKSFEEMFFITRVLSRRDLTAAIAMGQVYLGAIDVWIDGSTVQRRIVADLIRSGKQLSFALTEKAHGSDVLASDCQAVKVENGYLLSGEKWLINNGTRAAALTVFARTSPRQSQGEFSVFLVRKTILDDSSYSHMRKIRTHGIRGADISGIRFHEALMPGDALIGSKGGGLETALKGLMITRTLCAGFSLGALDTALRLTIRFSLERKLYGGVAYDIPHVRSVLINSFLDLLACECLAMSVTRGIHSATGQLSVWAAVVKYFVPTIAEEAIRNLAVILGARYYLREEFAWGIFQKVLRDSAVVSLFDGNTVINLNVISGQLRSLANFGTEARLDNRAETENSLKSVFSLEEPLPSFDPGKLRLSNQGRNDVIQGLEISLKAISDWGSESGVDQQTIETIKVYVGKLIAEISNLHAVILNYSEGSEGAPSQSLGMTEFSKRYCLLHTAAACVHMWVYSRNKWMMTDFFSTAGWLLLWLKKTVFPFSDENSLPATFFDNAAEEMLRLYKGDQLFSILRFQLARTGASEDLQQNR